MNNGPLPETFVGDPSETSEKSKGKSPFLWV